MALEQLGLSLSGQRSEAEKIGYLDAGQRPIHILGHSAILPPTQQDRHDAETSDMRQMSALQQERIAAGSWHRLSVQLGKHGRCDGLSLPPASPRSLLLRIIS
jgi:hypothetical protein